MFAMEQDELEKVVAGLDGSGLARFVEKTGPDLDDRAIRRVLRHPYVNEKVVAAWASQRRATSGYAARSLIARHPRTNATTALRFVPGLFWRDLLEISVDVRVAPSVRRVVDREVHPRILACVAAKARWHGRYTVRAGLSRNPKTPLRVQLALLDGLQRADLQHVVEDSEHSSVVRRRAHELAVERVPKRARVDPIP